MNKIWCFGDSFTAGHGCVEGYDYYHKYKKDGDMRWTEHLQNDTEQTVINLGQNGCSNYTIFDTIIDNFQNISKGDYVIIGKTFSGRFEVPYNGKLQNVFSLIEKTDDLVKLELSGFNKEMLETVLNFQYYFASDKFYKQRQDRYFQFVLKLLKTTVGVKSVIEWNVDDSKFLNSFDTISNDTNLKIVDFHFSFKGHRQFYEWITSQLNGVSKIL
jgi:hypothetical protein